MATVPRYSIAPRNYETERTELRQLTERWLAEHPYWLTRPFPSGPAARHAELGQPYRDLKEFVRSRLVDDNGVLEYPTETKAFVRKLRCATINARIPFGINRPTTGSVSGHKRNVGDGSSRSWRGIKEDFIRNPILLERKRAIDNRWEHSDHGRLVRSWYSETRRAVLREIKKTSDLATVIQSLQGKSAEEISQEVMNAPQPKMRSTSPLDWATNVGGVYIWYSERDDEDGIDFESVRFIVAGQESTSAGNHNAALMWNPKRTTFANNICPYEERFDHGFEKITREECMILGIDYVTLVDADMTRKEGLKIEKTCQYAINDLRFGYQRLHRRPGAYFKITDDGQKKRRIIGATFLPPGFFEDNPDIVIVGSHDGRH